MANSRLFRQLLNRVNKIERMYIPKTNVLGNYTAKENDDLRAYLLLVHAEIESYFENVSQSKANEAYSKWKNNNKSSNVLIALTSFCNLELRTKVLAERIAIACKNYNDLIASNHGIKEANILKMLLPLGLELSQLDNTWLSTLDFFGSLRGDVAHKSASVQRPLDPVTLIRTVDLILRELIIIDKMLGKL